VGKRAVRQALSGDTDCMVTILRLSDDPYRSETGVAPLSEVANVERLMPDEFIAPSGNDVTDAFLKYARPLIGRALPPYARLERHKVPPRLGGSG
jgi:6-phosphofructokinase 1